jgi:hypothetical protein
VASLELGPVAVRSAGVAASVSSKIVDGLGISRGLLGREVAAIDIDIS